MKIGIIFATNRQEATVTIISWLKEALKERGAEVTCAAVKDFNDFACDAYILGSAVYGFSAKRSGMGKFLAKHKNKIAKKPFGFFIVCSARKLPPKEKASGNPFIKFLKYTFLNPDNYLKSIRLTLPATALTEGIFSGYSDEEDKIKNNFSEQEEIVKQWAGNFLGKIRQ